MSVLFPGPHMLRTGLFTSWRNRPDRVREPGATAPAPHTTIEAFEKALAEAAGIVLAYTPVEEVAAQVVDAIRGRHASGSSRRASAATSRSRARAQSMLTRTNPTYIRAPGSLRTHTVNTSDRYLVISSDCHAGLPNEQYRDWLDPEFRDGVRREPRPTGRPHARARRRGSACSTRSIAEEWDEENEEGLRGGWDADRRDKELDADGVVGEVIFPDADAVTSGASAPFGAGLRRARRHADPTL